MTSKSSKERLSARVWPGISDALVPATDKRLGEIMDWATEHHEDWLFEFLDARSSNLQNGDGRALTHQMPPEDYLARRFLLTSAQAKVLSAFLAGQTLQEIADAQMKKINTVRTHFVQIRAKLNARDQADVVRIALLGERER